MEHGLLCIERYSRLCFLYYKSLFENVSIMSIQERMGFREDKQEDTIMLMTIKEALDAYRNGCKGRCGKSAVSIVCKGILAGMMIGMGAAGSSVAAHGISDVGCARLIAAAIFPVGLMMVILLGAELFTGDCLMAIALPEKNITPIQFVRMLALVYIGNFFGGILVSFLVVLSGQLNYSGGQLGAYTIKVALGKVQLDAVQGISSGVLCNILVCSAVLMALCAKDMAGKLLASFFVILLFVTSGYEHCVANMYYITAGLIAKSDPLYVQKTMDIYGITASQLEALNLKNMLVKNLLPVTIGNIIGGSFFVGLVLYYLNKDKVHS